ncbi:uncharacterized protein BDR25DRAFT_340226 [Lindgomyces ingoldianus]|uniref:Uncharacterized protein n=1 Tax=Lindgomyces ingoldianus TaxID=673940 RepID=A0ACB6R8M0_9PLEO|nr:uncharacterized protein BDR25DRAFT_340226 [Lindgomyces ingoldianus]KAF2475496.1 hypothetical protein BDR25DRAFT_340226 [Lindgomyces ingoldianus]
MDGFGTIDGLPDELILEIFKFLEKPIIWKEYRKDDTLPLRQLRLYIDRVYEPRPDKSEMAAVKDRQMKSAFDLQLPYSLVHIQDTLQSWGSPHIDLGLLISQTPKLEHLHVSTEVESSEHPPMWLDVLTQAAGGGSLGLVHAFSFLKVLQIDISYLPPATAISIFRMPSLKDLTIHNWDGEYDQYGRYLGSSPAPIVHGTFYKWPSRLANIEKLTLAAPCLTGSFISHAIRACKALKRLECRDAAWGDVREDEELYTKISDAILAHSKSLEELDIQEPFYNRQDRLHYGELKSTSTLIRLKTMRIPFGLLVGTQEAPSRLPDCLPSSIETLILAFPSDGEPEGFERQLNDLCETCVRGRFPHLRYILIRWATLELVETFPAHSAAFAACNICLDIFAIIAPVELEPPAEKWQLLQKTFTERLEYDSRRQCIIGSTLPGDYMSDEPYDSSSEDVSCLSINESAGF